MREKIKTGMIWMLLGALLVSPALTQVIGALPFNLLNGQTADASQVMANYNKIVSDTNANAAKNGVNSDITQLTAFVGPMTATQGGSTRYVGGASTGTINAQVVATVSPAGYSLTAGNSVFFIPGNTLSNSGPATLNVGGTGAKAVMKRDTTGLVVLVSQDIKAGVACETVYDGTQYVITSPC